MNTTQIRIAILIFIASFNSITSMAQNQLYKQLWEQYDSLMDNGLEQQAAKTVQQILDFAKKEKNNAEYLNASVRQIQLKINKTENQEDAFELLESLDAVAYNNTDKALVTAIKAVSYTQYFGQDRWNIIQRTKVSTANETLKPTAWTETQFVDTIYKLFDKTLSYKAELLKTPIEQYNSLLLEINQTGKTDYSNLYEFILKQYLQFNQQNIDYFSQDFKQYRTVDTSWLTLQHKIFIDKKFASDENNIDIKKQTIQAFQLLTEYYLNNKNTEKLAETDWNRIMFFKDNFVFGKKTIATIVNNLALHYAHLSISAKARHYNIAQELQDKTIQLIDAVKEYEELIYKFPNTKESNDLYESIANLKAEYFSIKGENVVLPETPFKILLEYQNIKHCELAIVPYLEQNKNESYENYKKRVSNQKAIKQYSIDLPGTEDLMHHRVEFKIDALPMGRYFIISLSPQQEVIDYYNWVDLEFQVSNIAYLRAGNTIKILDRTIGTPLPNATIKFSSFYKDNINKSFTTNDKGEIKLDESINYSFDKMLISFKDDKLTEQANLSFYKEIENSEKRNAFIFTDRDIYRPGQTIYFKGIVVNKKPNNVTEVVANKKVKVILTRYSYGGTPETSIELTTNEFGSVQGSFIAPENGFTGNYLVKINGNESKSIQIEEYKRPKFFNEFDTLKGDFFVNDLVNVKGQVKSSAGNNIDAAKVEYSIVRNVRFPFPWRCYWYPMLNNSSETINVGSTITDEQGKYTISFNAIPDNTNPELFPVFTYTINVKITDQNGETHEFTQSVSAAYRDALVDANIREDITTEDLKNITVKVTNVNNIEIPNEYTFSVVKLDAPKQLLKSRLWETPDQFLYDEPTFKTYFPNDVYKNENDKEVWKELHTTFTKTYSGKQALDLMALKAFPQNGWYLVNIKTKDAKGQEVIQKYYTHAIIDWNSKIEKDIAIVTNREIAYTGDQLKTKVLTKANDAKVHTVFKALEEGSVKDMMNFTVTEGQRGGIHYVSYFIKDNRIYETKKFVKIPFNNKDLQIKLLTERSKLLPGSKEKWSYNITGEKSKIFQTEFLAGMYDASLDALYKSNWDFNNLMTGVLGVYIKSNFNDCKWGRTWINVYKDEKLFSIAEFNTPYYDIYAIPKLRINYDEDIYRYSDGSPEVTEYYKKRAKSILANKAVSDRNTSGFAPMSGNEFVRKEKVADVSLSPRHMTLLEPTVEGENDKAENTSFSPRTNFNETAYFYPQLRTNANGDVSFEFTMPEALTSWRWRTFAHTKDWKIGYLEGEVKTQKDLMVQPNIPRVFRQMDDVTLSSKIVNLTNENIQAETWVEILNAKTLQSLALPFRLQNTKQLISIPAGQSKEVSWNIHIPESIYEPVILRIMAQAGNHTDGEEHYIPVITNRMLVTETLPLPMLGNGNKDFTFNKLLNANSKTLLHKGLTVEYTANPTWYVVQALPYLASYPYDCAEQVFSRFYGNAIAADIVKKTPKIEKIFNEWQTKDMAALISNLQKNEQLKSALLEETPWVLEAQDETAQKQRIAALFETQKLSRDVNKTLKQLEKKQLSNGAFSWFEGMYPNRYITQTIALGLLKMQDKNIAIAKETEAQSIIQKAMQYLESKMVDDYQNLINRKIKLDQNNLSPSTIQYLYAFSLSKQNIPTKHKKEYEYYLSQVKQYWNTQGLMMQAYIAEILYANQQETTAKTIIESLRQRAIINEEMGMYWKYQSGYYGWYEAPIETQAILIQAFKKIDKKANEIAQMQTWLIKNKQTNRWHSTKATVEACYALLADNTNILDQQAKVNIQIGDKNIASENIKQQAGTGYFIANIEGKAVNTQMGNIKVTVTDNNAALPSWGAVYWQYFEQYDKITNANTSLKIQKEIFKATNTTKGEVLNAITSKTPIHIGDKVVVRITVTSDRDLEYVHIKDTRAACFEPKDVLSQYHYKGALGYYQSTKDISTNFFVDNLSKGTYVLEYVVYANAKGTYSSGIANIQCMYAPEFTAHSSGEILKVE